MRVGIVAGSSTPADGGGFTFVTAVLKAVTGYSGGHEFILWDREVSEPDLRRSWRERVKHTADAVGAGWLIRSTARLVRSAQSGLAAAKLSPLEQFIRDLDIDVVWFLYPRNNLPVAVPFIATVWDLQHRRQPFFPEVNTTGWTWDAREAVYRSSLPRAARIITGTRAGKDEIIAFYGISPENIVVNPIPVVEAAVQRENEARLDVKAKYGLKREFLFYPAQFWPHKNHVNLLLALALLKKEASLELDLVLTGDDKGNLDHVHDTVAALDLKPQVHILGFVPKADLDGLYREALCLSFASFFGPDNIPPLEAFALGCPVVAAGVPGSEEQLGSGALLFDPADPADIAKAILTVRSDLDLRAELIRRGKEIAAARSPDAYIEQICRTLDDLERIRRCWGPNYLHT